MSNLIITSLDDIAQPTTMSNVLEGRTTFLNSNERFEEREQFLFPVEKMSFADAMRTAKKGRFDFDALRNINNVIVVTKPDGGKRIVNACSDFYRLEALEEVLLPLEELLDQEFPDGYKVRYRHDEFARFFIDYVFPMQYRVGGKDPIFVKATLWHSYSGDMRFGFRFGVYRQWCSNGATIMESGMSKVAKHTKNRLPKVLAQMQIEGLKMIINSFDNLVKPMEILAEKPVLNYEERILEVVAATSFPESQVDGAFSRFQFERTQYDLPATDWLVYNAMNYQLNHSTDNFNMRYWNREKADSEVMQFLIAN
jgi:hypothetical protein